jgi:hypothetical protein
MARQTPSVVQLAAGRVAQGHASHASCRPVRAQCKHPHDPHAPNHGLPSDSTTSATQRLPRRVHDCQIARPSLALVCLVPLIALARRRFAVPSGWLLPAFYLPVWRLLLVVGLSFSSFAQHPTLRVSPVGLGKLSNGMGRCACASLFSAAVLRSELIDLSARPTRLL